MVKRWLGISMMCGLLVGCGSGTTDTSSEGVIDLPFDGKSDNYIATNASEYILSGTGTAQLPENFSEMTVDEQQSLLDETVSSRTSELTRTAQRKVEDLIREANAELPQPEDENEEALKYFIYVKQAYRGGSAADVDVASGIATFRFELELVGSLELIGIVDGGDGSESFEIDDNGEILEVAIESSPSTDAFPRYDALFADGVYDVAIHFGGDYNEERYDLETAKWTVEYLLESGWQHDSVTTFADLRHDSGPFTQNLIVENREIEAQVYVYHAQMDDDAGAEQSLLLDLVKESVAKRDIIIYSGHAGANSGFLLDYHPRYEWDDADFDEVEMRDEYQIFVFDGCNSYRTYVDALLENPAKTYDNTDAVTTVNTTPFSAGYEIVNRFVHWLTFADQDGGHIPVSWNTLLQGVNDDHPDVHYGVHGIDSDPTLNPHGGSNLVCSSCNSNADCGGGGNYCVNYEDGAACTVACTTDAACGDGYSCSPIFDDPDLFYIPKQCIRDTLSCG